MMQTKEIELIKDILSTPKKIAIIPHKNPDGDALGSALGLFHILKKLNHEVKIISPNDFPDFLSWLPASESIEIFEKNKEATTEFLNSSDLLFTLDFNAFHRTGDAMENVLNKIKAPFVMIDHHQMPDDYALITVSDVNYGSTCELLYNFLNELNLTHLINKDSATCIYTGIVTDSGSFKFQKTTGNTHRVVADLIDRGVNNPMVHESLFNTSSYSRLQLLGRALENLKVLPQHKTAFTTLSQKELYEFNFQKGDTEGIVNYGLSIKDIDFAAIFIENKDEGIIKISFRSEGNFDVNEFARNHFSGGGHINAAGGKSLLTLNETINRFIDILAKENKQ